MIQIGSGFGGPIQISNVDPHFSTIKYREVQRESRQMNVEVG